MEFKYEFPLNDNWDVDSKSLHDTLLRFRPDGAVHDSASCEFCTTHATGQLSDDTEGGVLDVSTQEDIDKAVSAAVAPLQAELEALREFKANVESTDAVNAAREELREQIEAAEKTVAELRDQLDIVSKEAEQATAKYDEVLAWLDAEAAEAQRQAEIEALKEERTEAVKALELFTDEHIDKNSQRYAEMDEESFEAAMADWKAVKAAAEKKAMASEQENDDDKVVTSFTATRDEDGKGTQSNLRDVMRLRTQGIDPRRIRS